MQPSLQSFIHELTETGTSGTLHKLAADMMGGSTVEQSAMGTGKGMKPKNTAADRAKIRAIGGGKKLKKTAEEEAGDTVQDVLSEMLRQSEYHPDEEQPFWADQGATSQEAVDDPAYGHGKGMSDRAPLRSPRPPKGSTETYPAKAKSPPVAPPKAQSPKTNSSPKKTPKSSEPNPTPVRMGPKMLAMKTAQIFLSKQADTSNPFIGGLTEQRRPPRPRPLPAPPPPRRTISMEEAQGMPKAPPPAPKPRGTQDMLRDSGGLDGPDATPAKPKPMAIKPPAVPPRAGAAIAKR